MSEESTAEAQRALPGALLWIGVIGLVYFLLVGVGTIGAGFRWVSGGNEGAAAIFAFASNPIVGVILGILATALVQSSSTVTSVIVGLVAGGVPVSIAVPMIMGANMGTTITNTIVSLGNLRDIKTFKKSFQAATVHDFFNLYSIFIFLPIEILFQPLERMAGAMSTWFVGDGSASVKDLNFLGAITKPVSSAIVDSFAVFPTFGGYMAIVMGIAIVIGSVLYLGRMLRSVMTGKAKDIIRMAIGKNALAGVGSGTAITVLVQSSSTTTSLVVPLAGAGVLSLKQVFPFTMGANIGTCITALLAATAVSGPNEVFALQIALVHLMYNVFGVLAFLYIPWLKHLPIRSAKWLGHMTELNRGWALAYLLAIFFVLPGTVLGGQMVLSDEPRTTVEEQLLDQTEKELEDAGLEIE